MDIILKFSPNLESYLRVPDCWERMEVSDTSLIATGQQDWCQTCYFSQLVKPDLKSNLRVVSVFGS